MEMASWAGGHLNHAPDTRKLAGPPLAGYNDTAARIGATDDQDDQDSMRIKCNNDDSESSRPLLLSNTRNDTFARASGDDDDDEDSDNDGPQVSTSPAHPQPPPPRLFQRGIIFALLISLLLGFTSSLLSVPEVRLLEMALCRDYYRIHDPSVIAPPPLSYVAEPLCKLDSIQVDLAYLSTARSLISSALGVVLTIPYGRLSSRIGRRPLLLLGLTGEILAYFWVVLVCYFHQVFATKWVLLSPTFILVGGGSKVIAATVNMVITDVTANPSAVSETSSQRQGGDEGEAIDGLPSNNSTSNGTTAFYLLGATMVSSSLAGVSLGSYLLSVDLWLPYKVNSVVLVATFGFLVVGMPETLKTQRHEARTGTGRESGALDCHGTSDNDAANTSFVDARQQAQGHARICSRFGIRSTVYAFISKIRREKLLGSRLRSFGAVLLVCGHRQRQQKEIGLVLLLIFLTVFTASSGRLLIQYASKALDWSLSSIGYVFGVRFLVSLLVLVVLAAVGIVNANVTVAGTNARHGFTTKLIEKAKFRVLTSDIWIVRSSFMVLGLGTLFTAVGNGPLFIMGIVLGAVGGGLAPALQGLLARLATAATLRDRNGDTERMGQDVGGGERGRGTRDTAAEVFSSAALFELLAELAGGFVFAGLFDLGTRGFAGIGIGLPFYICAILTFSGAGISLMLPEA